MKILLIEDDKGCRIAIEAFLQAKIPTEVLEFTFTDNLLDGIKASKTADAVILDLHLPDSSDPSDTITAFTPLFKEIPTIVISASDQLPCVMTALESGARGFICKPKLEGMAEAFIEIIKSRKEKK